MGSRAMRAASQGQPASSPGLPGRQHVPVSLRARGVQEFRRITELLLLDWICEQAEEGPGRDEPPACIWEVSGTFRMMQCGELGNLKTRPFLLPLIYEMARCMSQSPAHSLIRSRVSLETTSCVTHWLTNLCASVLITFCPCSCWSISQGCGFEATFHQAHKHNVIWYLASMC